MTSDPTSLTLALHPRITEISAGEWDACAGNDNPFISHAFLSALEESGSTGPRTGWLPQHLALRDPSNQLVAVAPLYLKTHSYGEYVFDHGWAQAFENAGGQYYPKLQVASPFSPVTGPRLLRRPGSNIPITVLGNALRQVCTALQLSSVHITFCPHDEWQALGQAGWLQRTGLQFHWENADYSSFDDFLETMPSRKRKILRRERREANTAGLTFQTLRGTDIHPRHWDAFYEFYTSTIDRKWGSAYLTRDFFPLLHQALGDKVVLMLAEDQHRPVAGALNLMSADTLYGRNWGATGHWPFLHFELCYYRAIDFAIEHKLKRVEAGAQGEHKIQRGYLPQRTFSAHWIEDPRLRHAVQNFLKQEDLQIQAEESALHQLLPFKAPPP